MFTISVLLSGRLKLDGYGKHLPVQGDGTFHVEMGEGETAADLIRRLGIPIARAAMVMINGRKGRTEASLNRGDRVIVIPHDVAALWRFLGLQNLGMDSVCDF
jgi:hypothetical protein